MLNEGIELPPADCPVASGLAPATVLAALQEQLGDVLARRRDNWQVCRAIEALYHPGRYARVAYALLPHERVPSERYWPAGQIMYIQWPARRASRRGRVLWLAGKPVEVFCFPNDRRLRSLRKFTSRGALLDLWQRWQGAGRRPAARPESLRRGLIRYVPEQKFVARLQASVAGHGGRERRASIALRAESPQRARLLADRHRHAAHRARAAADYLYIPAAVVVDPSGLVAFEWVRGRSLLEKLRTADPDRVLRRTARMLHRFHRLPDTGLPQVRLADAYRSASVAIADLAHTCPDLAVSLAAVNADLFKRRRALTDVPPVTLHNDLHWNQIRIRQRRYGLLDLERMSRGDALADVANFATQLRMLGHRPELGVDRDVAADWSCRFLQRWAATQQADIPAARLHFHAGVSLVKLAWDMMRHLRPGWRALARQCVAEAEAELSASRHGAHSW